jgi:hypothetical protein
MALKIISLVNEDMGITEANELKIFFQFLGFILIAGRRRRQFVEI